MVVAALQHEDRATALRELVGDGCTARARADHDDLARELHVRVDVATIRHALHVGRHLRDLRRVHLAPAGHPGGHAFVVEVSGLQWREKATEEPAFMARGALAPRVDGALRRLW